ncbi:MAG: glycosyltransferase family 4 protein [Prevotella sp.]|nr:glycosyltransferase family 4 protein [Prevotella sp.]
MEQQRKRVLIVTNLPTPYKIDFYKELGKYCDLTIVIEARRLATQKFNWNDDNIDTFKLIYLDEGFLNERKVNFKILRYLKRSYDYIIIAAYYMPTELLAIFFLKTLRIPYWFESDGGMINRGESELHRRFKNFVVSGAKGYISPSAGSDEYLSYYKANPFKIYRYPFTSLLARDILQTPLTKQEKHVLRAQLSIKEGKVVLAVGQFIPRKGFDILMQAAARMDKSIGFYIVGGIPTEEYLQMQKSLDLENVHFEGFKTKEQLAEYFKAADLFVLPTREDIWGLVINEAMAYALPVITTKKCVAGIELIQDKHCLVDVEDVDGLRVAMERILNNEDLAKRLAVENLEKISDYTIERMAEAHVKILGL